MPKPDFEFKQFSIHHDKCAMKVNTDGIILGAWVDLTQCHRILDVGTGTGLIALMVAQRNAHSPSHITAVEIDHDAAQQAQENVAASPWPKTVEVIHGDVMQWRTSQRFDHLISNPPYFANALINPSQQKTTARHQNSLTLPQLLTKAHELTTDKGKLSLILPAEIMVKLLQISHDYGWFKKRVLNIKHNKDRQILRMCVEFTKLSQENGRMEEKLLPIRNEDNSYTHDYKRLCREFYLQF